MEFREGQIGKSVDKKREIGIPRGLRACPDGLKRSAVTGS